MVGRVRVRHSEGVRQMKIQLKWGPFQHIDQSCSGPSPCDAQKTSTARAWVTGGENDERGEHHLEDWWLDHVRSMKGRIMMYPSSLPPQIIIEVNKHNAKYISLSMFQTYVPLFIEFSLSDLPSLCQRNERTNQRGPRLNGGLPQGDQGLREAGAWRSIAV